MRSFPLGDLYRDLRLEAEAFFLQRNRLYDVAAKSLVTRLHIAEVDIGKCVGKQSENPVAHRVSEVKHAMRTSGQKARPVDYVGAPFDQRFQQYSVFRWIVFKIGILDDDEIPRSFLNTAMRGGVLSPYSWPETELEFGDVEPVIVQGSPASHRWTHHPRKSVRSPKARQALAEPPVAVWRVRCTRA